MNKVPLLIVLAAVASASAGSATPARSTVTVRVDDSRITSPSRWPSGYVDVHIVTAGNVHHRLAFWHLNPGVTVKRFRAALNSAQGPFRIATAVGGNGPMLAGHVDAPCISSRAPSCSPTSSTGRRRGSQASRSPGRPYPLTLRRPSERSIPGVPLGSPGAFWSAGCLPLQEQRSGCARRDDLPAPQEPDRGRPCPLVPRWWEGASACRLREAAGRTGVIGARWTSWFALPRLEPGHYVLACFLPDDRGVLHAAMGMVTGFEVR